MAESVSSREILPFIYTVDISITSLSGTGTKTLVLGSDSEFELYGFEARTNQDMITSGAIAGTTTTANPVQAPDNFKILIKDISTGRDLFTNSLARSLVCGNASNLFVPEGYKIRFPRQNQLQFDFTNLYTTWPTNSSNTLDITFALRGYKIFGRMG
ncbi:MAG: hypothetical protein EBT07_11270 [Actinobacteria bacterium]|nr:hypothetical protein [Actinomycetota bacterium]